MPAKNARNVPVSASSGNIFVDLGFADPEEALARAQFASRIHDIAKRRRLTPTAAADLMGIARPKVSALLDGRLASFSIAELMRVLTVLRQDLDIVIKGKPRRDRRGHVVVVEPRG